MKLKNQVKLATAQYNIDQLTSWQQYQDKINRWVLDAKDQGCELLLFPEYASMELVSLFSTSISNDLHRQLSAIQALHDQFVVLYKQLAICHDIYIQPGTFPIKLKDNSYRNRAYFFDPDGSYEFQDKLIMTRFENEQWNISSGERIKVFNTRFGLVGINVCYDSEFPMIARKQIEMGANLILVPSCTDTLTGFHRVRIGCQARALENQCYVVHTVTVGDAPWSEPIESNIGAAAVYTPVDYGFPEDGILVKGQMNATQWVYAELDLSSIKNIRETGQVFNFRDWPAQFRLNY